MKKKIALLMAAVMLFGVTVGATIAWLTSLSATVTNTMTVGDVKITLDETDVDLGGVQDSSSRVTENRYKLYPGKSYTKDPVIHVDEESEDCFVFVKVVNALTDIEDAGPVTIKSQMTDNGWFELYDENGKVENVYYYEGALADSTGKVVVGGEQKDIPVFQSFTVDSSVEGTELATYEGETITIKAYAVQAEGFNSPQEAWAASPTNWIDPVVNP